MASHTGEGRGDRGQKRVDETEDREGRGERGQERVEGKEDMRE